MEVIIQILDPSHVTSVDDLGRSSRGTLGFLPEEALLKLLSKGWVYGALTPEGTLVGYLIFARYTHLFRITQLCVSKSHRGQGIGRILLDVLKKSATTQSVIKLRCRRDFPAHHMWPKLGFIAVDEGPGRSAAGYPLTLWSYKIAQDDELGLWRADTDDEAVDVVIDAQVFFNFDEPDAPSTLISKGLLNDFLVDSLKLWITDELFNEINRKQSVEERNRSRARAHGFGRIEYDPKQFEHFIVSLQSILPYRTDSEKSDIHHLAKTSASAIRTFVTKDERVLRKADAIRDLCGITILHPVALITSLHEEAQRISLSPSRVSGLRLSWKRSQKSDIELLCSRPLKDTTFGKARLRERLLSFSADPTKYCIDLLHIDQEAVAYRVLDRSMPEVLSVELADVVQSANEELFANFLIADCLALAAEENRSVVNFARPGTPNHFDPSLAAMGFIQCAGAHQRIVLTRAYAERPLLDGIMGLANETIATLASASDAEFERACAPTVCSSLPCFLVPIKPSFAMGLIDRNQSASDLFGGDPTVLLRWENVYYRSKNRHHMLKSPGRILWYVSSPVKEIVAISHLDEVSLGLPKELFKRYRKFGILEWRDVFELCNKDVHREIMALKFSQTFCFRNRIPLSKMKAIFDQIGLRFSLQTTSVLPHSALLKIFDAAYGAL
jgi:GNAT superfamily N-acetyltransferase